MTLLLGVDGGGTRTRVQLVDANGALLGEGEAGTANHHALGMPAAQAELLKAIANAFERAGIPAQRVSTACLGLAGTDRADERAAWTAWAEKQVAECVMVVNDGALVLAAGTPENWGVALVAGTGSVVLGKTRQGKTARAGGWGYLIGDEGSSYELAREALRAAAQAADGRGPATALLPAILEYWQARDPSELIAHVYRPGAAPAELAVLAPLVTRCAGEGDAVARRLVEQAGQALAMTVRAVCVALDFQEEVPLALTGGLVLSAAAVREALLRALGQTQYRMNPVTPVDAPVRGAVRLARSL